MAKIFFPLLNLTSMVVLFYFMITEYINQSNNADSFIDMEVCNLMANFLILVFYFCVSNYHIWCSPDCPKIS